MNEITQSVDDSFIFILVICVFLLVGVTAAMIYFVVRFSEKNNPKPDQTLTGNTTLEIAWTIIPLLLVLAMFFYGYEGFKIMRNPPPDAMVVKVTGKMWFWHFEYANGKQIDSTLYLPAGKNIKFELNSTDVLHSFYIAAFRTKEDCVPGRTTYMWFNTTKEGVWDIECAEYCGLNHSYMLGKVKVIPENEFNEWVNKVDSTKIRDSLKTADSLKSLMPKTDTIKTVNKTDSLKTSGSKTDTTKAPGNKKDTLKSKDMLKPKNR